MSATLVGGIDSPDMRAAGAQLLSVALMDARNHTLHLADQIAAHLQVTGEPIAPAGDLLDPLRWTLGHVGWFQERWIARNLQRNKGRGCDPLATRLPSLDSAADTWWDDGRVAQPERWRLALPEPEAIKAYLLATLESTLETLERTTDAEDPLYFYRLALAHEDMHGEALVVAAQAWGVPLQAALPGAPPARAPLRVPATAWTMGSAPDGSFCFDNERAAHRVDVPEFEIDAQPVAWAQYIEFVDDGGYDRAELWHPDGWRWVQQHADSEGAESGGRAPRYVQQIGVASGAVLQTRFGTARRMLGGQPVMHVSWWEADAWCRWAGRRLPAEVEWELAACTAARRGFRWGEVWEWTGATARPYPGFVADPWRDYSRPCFGSHKVLRGASFATRERMRQPRFRNFQPPGNDLPFCGFRSCAL